MATPTPPAPTPAPTPVPLPGNVPSPIPTRKRVRKTITETETEVATGTKNPSSKKKGVTRKLPIKLVQTPASNPNGWILVGILALLLIGIIFVSNYTKDATIPPTNKKRDGLTEQATSKMIDQIHQAMQTNSVLMEHGKEISELNVRMTSLDKKVDQLLESDARRNSTFAADTAANFGPGTILPDLRPENQLRREIATQFGEQEIRLKNLEADNAENKAWQRLTTETMFTLHDRVAKDEHNLQIEELIRSNVVSDVRIRIGALEGQMAANGQNLANNNHSLKVSAVRVQRYNYLISRRHCLINVKLAFFYPPSATPHVQKLRKECDEIIAIFMEKHGKHYAKKDPADDNVFRDFKNDMRNVIREYSQNNVTSGWTTYVATFDSRDVNSGTSRREVRTREETDVQE